MSLTRDLVRLIRSRPVAPADLEQAALLSLDALACAYAGSATEVGKILRAWAEATALDNTRATFLMAALTHITETDDLHRASVTHPGCIVVPAALSLAETTGAGAERMLEAIVHGFEAMCRIGAAVGPAHYRVWHNTATCGPFGSAMAAATLLGLDEAQTVDALGNAGTQAGGFWEFMQTGAMSKHLHAGRACESGLIAATLARQGLTGPPEILEGNKGFFVAMCDDPVPGNVLADPDASWQVHQTSIKPWPSCRHTHPVIDCALEIHGLLQGDHPRAVRISTYQAALDVCNTPVPETEYQAKFSLQHCAAIALTDGRVGLDSFDAAARKRGASLRPEIAIQAAHPFTANYPDSWGAEVSVETGSGQTFKLSRKDCKGDPELMLDAGEMRDKALGLLRYGGLEQPSAVALCDSILALPGRSAVSDLFSRFQQSIRR